MPAVLVHGVPETTEVWGPLVERLERDDVVLLGLPGFGSPAPDFEPTKEHYASWLTDQLATFDQVDLVAHDWGGLLALRILADRPATVRSWALDMGDLDATFKWHDMAELWISSEGEGFMAAIVESTEADRGALLAASGVPEAGAAAMGRAFDQTMADCILALYRSATDIGGDWGPGIDQITGPGLILDAADDPFKAAGRSQRLADRTGAELLPLAEAGHWWMLDSPDMAADALQRFWSSLS